MRQPLDTVGDWVAVLSAMPQDKRLVVVDCGADEVWDVLSITDNDAEPDPDEEDEPTRKGVVEVLIDT